MKTINLNDTVRVKVLEKGKKIIQSERDRFKKDFPNVDFNNMYPLDEDDYLKISLWQAMQLFGPHIGLGISGVIETNIEVLD